MLVPAHAQNNKIPVAISIKVDKAGGAQKQDSSEKKVINGLVTEEELALLKKIDEYVKLDLNKRLRSNDPDVMTDAPAKEKWSGDVCWMRGTQEQGTEKKKEGFIFSNTGFPLTFGFERVSDARMANEFQKLLLRLLVESIESGANDASGVGS